METFHDPSARDEARMAFRFGDFLSTRTNVWNLSPRGSFGSLADIACIKAEIFDCPFLRTDDSRVQQRADPLAVVYVGSADDKRQRDATGVDERVSLGFHFFPRSVGFGPTDSCASGASTFVPSPDGHSQAIPSNSSYSASPLRQIAVNNPALAHCRNRACRADEPSPSNFSRENAFQMIPVRSTYTIPEKYSRSLYFAFLPPPGLRL